MFSDAYNGWRAKEKIQIGSICLTPDCKRVQVLEIKENIIHTDGGSFPPEELVVML